MTRFSPRLRGIRHGYKSGLEETVAGQILRAGQPVNYETKKVPWTDPMVHTYHADFELANGIIVETKGRFMPDDRRKHLLVKMQHPHLDIRFVFSRGASPLYKGSTTTYAQWATKHGFKWAEKLIPAAWFKEPKREIPKT